MSVFKFQCLFFQCVSCCQSSVNISKHLTVGNLIDFTRKEPYIQRIASVCSENEEHEILPEKLQIPWNKWKRTTSQGGSRILVLNKSPPKIWNLSIGKVKYIGSLAFGIWGRNLQYNSWLGEPWPYIQRFGFCIWVFSIPLGVSFDLKISLGFLCPCTGGLGPFAGLGKTECSGTYVRYSVCYSPCRKVTPVWRKISKVEETIFCGDDVTEVKLQWGFSLCCASQAVNKWWYVASNLHW